MAFGFGSGWHLARIEWTNGSGWPGFEGTHPKLGMAVSALKTREFDRLRGLSHDETPDGMHELRFGAAWCTDLLPALGEAADADSSDGAIVVWAGAVQAIRSWRYRTYQAGGDVPEARAELAMVTAGRAADRLARYMHDTPGDTEAAAWFLQALTVEGASDEDLHWARDYLRACPDPHLAGRRTYLSARSAKWYGSYDEALAFAREEVAAPGAPACYNALIACAHIEQWVLHHMRNDAGAEAALLKSRAVRDDLIAADEAFRAGAGAQGDPADDFARNWLAFAMLVIGENARARDHMEALGARVRPFPWSFLAEMDKVIAFSRKKLGLPPLRATA